MLIYNYLRRRNIVIPPKSFHNKDTAYARAYVKDPIVNNMIVLMSFDLNSLYPHLIMQYNISPDTIVNDKLDVTVDKLLDQQIDTTHLQSSNLTMLKRMCQCFKKEVQGFLPKMMEEITRLEHSTKRRCLKQNKNIRLQRILNYRILSLVTITFRCRRRLH